MALLKLPKLVSLVLSLVLLSTFISTAQNYSIDTQKSALKVLGTSSLHDWEITAEKQSGQIEINTADKDVIKSLVMAFDVDALKSGKSGMDKNTRKALNYEVYKTIDFQLTSIQSVVPNSSGYQINATGKLTVSGTTKDIDLSLNLIVDKDLVTVSGKKALKMTTFNVEPPTALLGTIKTGDDIIIEFNTTFNKI